MTTARLHDYSGLHVTILVMEPHSFKTPRGTPPTAVALPAVSRSETVTVALRTMIMRGDFAAGFHLQEIPLAERLGVSRTPIREALSTLAKEGLVEPGPHRGHKVRTFAVEEVSDAYEMRATLEGMACRLVAERGLTQSEIRQVRDLLDTGDQIIERGRFTSAEHAAWGDMNAKLHQFLVDAAANELLKSFVQQTSRVPLASMHDHHWFEPDSENFTTAQIAHGDHLQIVDAIVHRQAGRAETRMREHLYLSRDLVRSRFRQQTVGFDAMVSNRPSQQKLTR